MSSLHNIKITIVEAIYSCIIKKSLSKDMEDDLVGLLREDAYMYIYFCWLLFRWYPLYSKHDTHLPQKYTTSRSS